MSNQNPSNPSRRRRIAGERQGTTRPAVDRTQETGSAQQTGRIETTPPAAEVDQRRGKRREKRRETRATPAGGADGSGDPGPARGVPGVVLMVLGLVAATAIGVAAYFWTESAEAAAAAQAESRAPAAAERAAEAVLSYNYETLEADKEKAARFLTDDYRSDYTDTVEELVAGNVDDLRADVQAQVVASSVTRASPDQADVLLFVNQTTTSTANNGEPLTALNRVAFDMREVDGTWLVNGITSY